MNVFKSFQTEILYFSLLSYYMLTHPRHHIVTQIFLFEFGLSLKLSLKVANFLKPIPL